MDENVSYAVKMHDDDVIFSKESLEEFIRLIQRQGINNLTVYSVSDLLAGDPPKYQTLTARFPPPSFEKPPQEFEFDELKDRKGYFVFVRYSFCWEGDQNNGEGPAGRYGFINDRKFTENENGEYHSLNEINGRHIFVKTINDIKYYVEYLDEEQTIINTDESSIFKTDISTENPLPDIFPLMEETNPNIDKPWYQTNGTFLTTIDNEQFLIKIRGFNDAGEYIGKMKIDPDGEEEGSDGNNLADNTDGYVLRGDGVWANSIDNDWLPVEDNKSSLGSNTQAWKNLYISSSILPCPDPDGKKVIGYASDDDLTGYTQDPDGQQYDDNGQHYNLSDGEKAALSPEPVEGKTIIIYKENVIGYCSPTDLAGYTEDNNGPQYDDEDQHYSLSNAEKEALSPEPTEGDTITIYTNDLIGYCSASELAGYTQDNAGEQYDGNDQHYSLTSGEIAALASEPTVGNTIPIYTQDVLGYCSATELAGYTQDNSGAQYDDNDQQYSLSDADITALASEPTGDQVIPIYQNVIAGYANADDFDDFVLDGTGDYFDNNDNYYSLTPAQIAALSPTYEEPQNIPIYGPIVVGYCSPTDLGDFEEDEDGDYFDDNDNHYNLTSEQVGDLSPTYEEPKNIPIYEVVVAGYCNPDDLGDFEEDEDGDYFDDDDNHYNLTPEQEADLSPNYVEPKTNPIYEDDNTASLGSPEQQWDTLYVKDANISGDTTIGSLGNPVTVMINGRELKINALPTTNGTTGQFWRGGRVGNVDNPANWSNQLDGPMKILFNAGANNNTPPTDVLASVNGTTGSAFVCTGAGFFSRNLKAAKVFNAVFNDYAECRTTIDLEPGHCVIDNDDGSLSCTSQRLQPGAQIISDTFGHSMGYDEEHQTHLAVAGRVLVYPYQPRENYHAGMAVCSAPDGTVDIMTREEIRNYPDCIVGIVSEIPQYEKWGTDQINVDGRIWIKVK